MGYKRLNLKNGTKLNEEHFKHFEDSLEKQASYFGESLEWVTLAPEQNVKIEESFGSLEHNGYPKNDKTYNFRVTLDGESYIFENVSSHKDDYGSCWEIGEPFDYSSDEFDWSTYPFSVYIAESAKIFDIAVSPSISDGEHTVKVEMLDEVVQKLDGKYIEPDTLDLNGLEEIDSVTEQSIDLAFVDSVRNIFDRMMKTGTGYVRFRTPDSANVECSVNKAYWHVNDGHDICNQFIGFYCKAGDLYAFILSFNNDLSYVGVFSGKICNLIPSPT